MTVKDLIEELKKYPENLPVRFLSFDRRREICTVEECPVFEKNKAWWTGDAGKEVLMIKVCS